MKRDGERRRRKEDIEAACKAHMTIRFSPNFEEKAETFGPHSTVHLLLAPLPFLLSLL